jgi:hypothetical protein
MRRTVEPTESAADPVELLDQIHSLVVDESTRRDAAKCGRGNRAATIRWRKTLQAIRNLARDGRRLALETCRTTREENRGPRPN